MSLFTQLKLWISPNIECKFVELLKKKWTSFGGTIADEYSDDVDYVLSGNTRSKNGLPRQFNRNLNWVDIRWIDDCIETGKLVPVNRVISPKKGKGIDPSFACIVSKGFIFKIKINTIDGQEDSTSRLREVEAPKLKSNDLLIEELVNRMNYHKLKKDKFKVLAYRKAIQSITDSNQIITSGKQAQMLPHVGKSIAEKIDEILKSGKLVIPNIEEIDQVVNLFKGIYGVGDSIASKWYKLGWRSLEDVQKHTEELTHDQKIGLKYYSDINTKIGRDEIIQIEKIVLDAIKKVDSGFLVFMVGSFRREESEFGDADFVVTHPELKWSSSHSMNLILQKIQDCGMEMIHLTDLSSDHDLYKGLCKLNVPGSLFRRIDIVMVPMDELGSALIQWTGNDLFNRRLRQLAKTKGMKLSQHGLFFVEHDGSVNRIASKTEMEIFEALGEPWKEPKDRLL